LRHGGGWLGLGFQVRGYSGRAPWPAGLEERLEAAVADRGLRGEAVDDSPREGPTAGGDRLPQLANGGGGGCRGDPVSLNLDCACRRPKYYMCRR
jgi:hypothetical protein